MICKTANISHGANALSYCGKGGELLWSHNCSGDAKTINHDFNRLQDMNTRAEKKSIHAIISFNPEDRELNNQELIEISEEYAKSHGFDKNQYAVYLHDEKEHLHLHIVANRIGINLKACSSSNSYYKNKDFAKEMEIKYQLTITNRKEKGKDFIPDNNRVNSIKETLDVCIASSRSIDEFCRRVEEYGIVVLRGRGITFVDNDGAKIKGSQIGREYSLKGIINQIELKNLNKEKTINPLTRSIVKNKHDFGNSF